MNEKQSKTRLDAQSSDSAKDLTPDPGAIYSEIISGCKTCLQPTAVFHALPTLVR